MSGNVKIGLAVGALVLAVFAATVIGTGTSIDVPNDPDIKDPNAPAEADKLEVIGYDFKPDTLTYDPASPIVELREHPAYYERGEHQVSYWIWNPHPEPLIVTFLRTSCQRCKYVDVGLPGTPKLADAQLSDTAMTLAGSTAGFSFEQAKYLERQRMEQALTPSQWSRIETDRRDITAEIPAAASKTEPTWAIIRLNINITESKSFEATLGFRKPNMSVPYIQIFRVDVAKGEPYALYPPTLDFGDVSENAASVSEALYYWSPLYRNDGPDGRRVSLPKAPSTRGDPFLKFDPPQALSDAECAELATRINAGKKTGMPMRVRGGYRYPMTLSRIAPDPQNAAKVLQQGLGPCEKTVEMVPDYGTVDVAPKCTIRANFLGAVTFEDGTKLDLGSFLTRDGVEKKFRLFSDVPGVELEAVPEQCEPKILTLMPLDAPELKNGRTIWNAKIKIEPNIGGGVLPDKSAVVFRIKGTGQLVTIPITGKGRS